MSQEENTNPLTHCPNKAAKLTSALGEGFGVAVGFDSGFGRVGRGNSAVAIVREGAEKVDDVASVVK